MSSIATPPPETPWQTTNGTLYVVRTDEYVDRYTRITLDLIEGLNLVEVRPNNEFGEDDLRLLDIEPNNLTTREYTDNGVRVRIHRELPEVAYRVTEEHGVTVHNFTREVDPALFESSTVVEVGEAVGDDIEEDREDTEDTAEDTPEDDSEDGSEDMPEDLEGDVGRNLEGNRGESIERGIGESVEGGIEEALDGIFGEDDEDFSTSEGSP